MSPNVNLIVGWAGVLLGMLSGAGIGLFFHRAQFAGGYDSWARRLMRLGHISFFGLGFVNIVFALTMRSLHLEMDGLVAAWIAGLALLIAAASMPVVCFGAAWKKPVRHLFFVPVLAAVAGVVLTIQLALGVLP